MFLESGGGEDEDDAEDHEKGVEKDAEDKSKEEDDEEVKKDQEVVQQAGEEGSTSKPENIPIDANHPQVLKIVEEVMNEANKQEPEISPEDYVDAVEEAIQHRYAELQEKRSDELV